MKTKYNSLWEKGLRRFQKDRDIFGIYSKVTKNCLNIMNDNDRNMKLRDFNERGNHFQDPIYQKLSKIYSSKINSGANISEVVYIIDALTRIGNRTMTEEEYFLLGQIPGENLISYKLDKNLEDLQIKLNEIKDSDGNITWMKGPFYLRCLPRNPGDTQ